MQLYSPATSRVLSPWPHKHSGDCIGIYAHGMFILHFLVLVLHSSLNLNKSTNWLSTSSKIEKQVFETWRVFQDIDRTWYSETGKGGRDSPGFNLRVVQTSKQTGGRHVWFTTDNLTSDNWGCGVLHSWVNIDHHVTDLTWMTQHCTWINVFQHRDITICLQGLNFLHAVHIVIGSVWYFEPSKYDFPWPVRVQLGAAMIAVYDHGDQHLVPPPEFLLHHDADGRVEVIVFAQDAILHCLRGGSADNFVLLAPPMIDISTDHVPGLMCIDQWESRWDGDWPMRSLPWRWWTQWRWADTLQPPQRWMSLCSGPFLREFLIIFIRPYFGSERSSRNADQEHSESIQRSLWALKSE